MNYKFSINGNFLVITNDNNEEIIRHPANDVTYLILNELTSNPTIRLLGIRRKIDYKIIRRSDFVSSKMIDSTGASFGGINNIKDFLDNNLSFKNGGRLGAGITISQKVNTFNDLIDGEEVGELAYVEQSQGTAWLPGSMGGNYYPSGWYEWDGTIWKSNRNKIAKQLDDLVIDLDSHISNLNNPHQVTKSQIGLGSVDNTSDIDKPISNSTQLALDGKADTNHNHIKADITDFSDSDYATSAQGLLADSAVQPNDLGTVATSNDYNDLDNKPTIPGPAPVDSVNGQTGVVNLDKSDIGLPNIDNTSDLDKPISTATQTALNGKVNNSQVLTDVPTGAVFTDTVYDDTVIQAELDQEKLDRQNGDEGTVSIHSDMNTVGANNVKQVLKYNGSTEFLPDTLELDDLDNVNTQNIIPEDGWILKYVNSNFIPVMKKTITSSLLDINTSNNTDLSKINTLVNFQRTGTYAITVNFSYSYNRGNTDFVANLEVDGFLLGNVGNGEILAIEPKDSAGNEFDGRGTNQKLNFSQTYYINIFTIGNKNINLSFRPEQNNIVASMWDASIIIEEKFGIINL